MFLKAPLRITFIYDHSDEQVSYILVRVKHKKNLSLVEWLHNRPSYEGHIPNACMLKGNVINGPGDLLNKMITLKVSRFRILNISQADLAILKMCNQQFCTDICKAPTHVNKKNFNSWLSTNDAKDYLNLS